MNRNFILISIGIVVLIILGAVFIFPSSTSTKGSTSGEITEGMELGYSHRISIDNGSIVIGGEENNEEFMPSVQLNKWGDESSLKISYPIEGEVVPVAEKDLIRWKNDDIELYFKSIKKTQIPSNDKVDLASDIVRYIKYGSQPLNRIAASYNLESRMGINYPTLSTYLASDTKYVFFGNKPAEKDLKDADSFVDDIVRFQVKKKNFQCPIIPVKANDTIVFKFYYPNIELLGEDLSDSFVEAINNSLAKYSATAEVKRLNDSIFYNDGLRIFRLGRIGYEEDTLLFFLYLNSPYSTEVNKRLQLKTLIQDTVILPYKGLNDIASDVGAEISDDIAIEFLNIKNYKYNEQTSTSNEDDLLSKMEIEIRDKEWLLNGGEDKILDSDRFEFDIVLNKIPKNNVFTYQIETKNLDFFYQPELTKNEIAKGFSRPSDVIGSYAVYREGNKNINTYSSKKEAEKYRMGKVFHIYRPKIIDSNDEWIWGELNVDEIKGELSITVDNDWLASASYPVIVDPTFGYTTPGASNLNVRNTIRGSLFTSTGAGTGVSITAYIDNAALKCTGITVKNALYASDSSFIAETNATEIPLGVGWIEFTFTSSPSISNADYILVSWGNLPGDACQAVLHYDSGATDQGKSQSLTYGTFPDPATFVNDDNKYSIYLTYDASSPTSTPSVNQVELDGSIDLDGDIQIQ